LQTIISISFSCDAKLSAVLLIIIINKVLIKVRLNKVIAAALYIYIYIYIIHSLWLKRSESTGLTVDSRMTTETEMTLNADGNTAVTACL